jgi:hypothetical protein
MIRDFLARRMSPEPRLTDATPSPRNGPPAFADSVVASKAWLQLLKRAKAEFSPCYVRVCNPHSAIAFRSQLSAINFLPFSAPSPSAAFTKEHRVDGLQHDHRI